MRGTFTVVLLDGEAEKPDREIVRGQNWYQVVKLIRKMPGVLQDELNDGAYLQISKSRKGELNGHTDGHPGS